MATAEFSKFLGILSAYLNYMQSTSCKMLGWMKHKLKSRLPGEISIISDMQGFPDSSVGKESTCSEETWVRSLGWEDPLEKGKATYSSILAWRIPWTI